MLFKDSVTSRLTWLYIIINIIKYTSKNLNYVFLHHKTPRLKYSGTRMLAQPSALHTHRHLQATPGNCLGNPVSPPGNRLGSLCLLQCLGNLLLQQATPDHSRQLFRQPLKIPEQNMKWKHKDNIETTRLVQATAFCTRSNKNYDYYSAMLVTYVEGRFSRKAAPTQNPKIM